MTYNNFFKLTKASHHVDRWSGIDVRAHRRSLSQHHAEVVAISLDIIDFYDRHGIVFRDDLKFEIVQYAASHDLPEVVTGDVKYVVKRENPELVKALGVIEDKVLSDLRVSEVSDITKFIVKLADLLAVEHEISEELALRGFDRKTPDGEFDWGNVAKIQETTFEKYKMLDKTLLSIGEAFLTENYLHAKLQGF